MIRRQRTCGRAAAVLAILSWSAAGSAASAAEPPSTAPSWSADVVAEILADARERGDVRRGAGVFHEARTGCTSCHAVAGRGGAVGPELTAVARCLSPEEIVESLYWPDRAIKPEYRAQALTLADGRVLQGIVTRESAAEVLLVDAQGRSHRFRPDDVVERAALGSLMPANVVFALPKAERRDLVRYLLELGRTPGIESWSHRPEPFDVPREPLRPAEWPNRDHPVNRHRVYDAYTKQARLFRGRRPLPLLLPAWPGLDGGSFGHWGSRPEEAWVDGRRNQTDLGSLQAWPLAVGDRTIPRAVNVRLGDDGSLSACFNPDTLAIEAAWTGGFIGFATARYGFLSAATPVGVPAAVPAELCHGPAASPGSFEYRGFYRHGGRVVFSYAVDGVEMLDAPWAEHGRLTRAVGPVAGHPLEHVVRGGPAQWPQKIATPATLGTGAPYAIDTIAPPFENPWRALLFLGGVDFFSNGDAAVCTMQGDVWRVSGLDATLGDVGWRRIASGLNQPLGLVVADDVVHVLGGDQITRLEDRNGDGEADFYACVTNRFEPSGGHNFKCGLERDPEGSLYTASHQGLLRVSPDGRTVDVLAVGLRNPDGLGILPDGTLTVPVSEGDRAPASAICAVRPVSGRRSPGDVPDFRGEPPALPLVYLPRGIDNSSGGQVYVVSDRWGPLGGLLVHLSFGTCTHLLVLRDEVAGQPQGAVVPLPGDFRSGVHRGRFSPADGQLYVCGMRGWQSYAVDDGCLQRVRYVGGTVQQPVRWRAHRNGVLLGFSAPLAADVAADASNHFAQCWNYRYGRAYGSPEFSPSHYGTVGHDPLPIRSATVLPDGRSLFLELPDIQPVSQLHLHVAVGGGETRDVFATVHALAEPFDGIPHPADISAPVAAHPILRDIAMLRASVENPWRASLEHARPLTIEAAANLAYEQTEVRAAPDEPIALTFVNPDVVPHNWVLVAPGSLAAVGAQADALIADPEAVARHYVPKTDDVIVYADVTEPGGRQTVHFRAPRTPGRYPYLCTFPGHWKLMNGALLVAEEKPADVGARARDLFRRDNLVAWCVVPFDAVKRGPEERAAMLERLGFRQLAYDWRDEHVPTFEREWDALARHGIGLHAFWAVPPDLPGLLASFRRRGLHPTFWVVIEAEEQPEEAARIAAAAARIRPIADAAAAAGCAVAVYNHGGWGGEPENMVAVVEAVDRPNVGIVYNLHHGHDHLPRFERALAAMLPHLRCLNLNGMTAAGDRRGRKIMVLGQGDLDVELARTVCRSGYAGPIGILNHTDHDAEARLGDNVAGLDWIVGELTGQPVPRPKPRTP